MKKNDMLVNLWLSLVLGATLLVMMIGKAIRPWAIFPEINLPMMAAVITAAFILNYLTERRTENEENPADEDRKIWFMQAILAGVTFGVLLTAAGAVTAAESFLYALCGGGMFLGLSLAFESMIQRLETTCENRMAVIPAGCILFLACQCFAGMII